MSKRYTVCFREEIAYAVELEVENDANNKAIVELALQELEDNGRDNYSVDTSGLKLESVEEED
jgi:hypothetical protein